jgi:hypothetical protein
MRKLVIILIALLAVVTFIRAMDNSVSVNGTVEQPIPETMAVDTN